MITQDQQVIDFIEEMEPKFAKGNPIPMGTEESIDFYYIQRLFEYLPTFRLYILTAFCLYMDQCTNKDGTAIAEPKKLAEMIQDMVSKFSSVTTLNRVFTHIEKMTEHRKLEMEEKEKT